MKVVTMLAKVDEQKCTGCKTCQRVCPTLAIEVVDKLSRVDSEKCTGCGNCNQRCPEYAVTMVKRETPMRLYVDPKTVSSEKIEEICGKARMNPEQIVCYCTATRAEEVAAAIIKGADTPEKISLQTGVRTGCKVECIQPILRLLEAAGIEPARPDGYQWYGRTITVWEIPEQVKRKYSEKGFYFDEDIKLLNEVAKLKKTRKEDS